MHAYIIMLYVYPCMYVCIITRVYMYTYTCTYICTHTYNTRTHIKPVSIDYIRISSSVAQGKFKPLVLNSTQFPVYLSSDPHDVSYQHICISRYNYAQTL